MSSSFDEVKLTAYALGELKGKEAQEVEKLLSANPAARSFVEEMRATGLALTKELQKEPLPRTKVARKQPQPNWWALGASFGALSFAIFQSREILLSRFQRLMGGVDYAMENAIHEAGTGGGKVASAWTDLSSRGPIFGVCLALLLSGILVFAGKSIFDWFQRNRD